MKNYLFAPFKNDDDKMDTWNSCKSGIDQGIMIFLGRLESSYDVIIEDLKADNERLNAECWCGCNDDLKAEYNNMKADNERIRKTLVDNTKQYDELKAENKTLKQNNHYKKNLTLEIESLQAEIKSLKADYNHDTELSYELDDKHIEIIKELEEKNERLQSHVDKYGSIRHGELVESNKRLQSKVDELKADVKRHEKQYHMMASSHYPKEYQAEADEWFEHNPQDEKLFFFMVGGSGVDEDGDVIDTLNVGADAIAECDNYKGVVSVETYD